MTDLALTIQDGAVIGWHDANTTAGDYQDARFTFDTWLRENLPEAPNFAGGFLWDWAEDSALARSYLLEFAASGGIDLDEAASS